MKLNSNTIFITDSIINSLALIEKTNNPAIVINSVEGLTLKMYALLEEYDYIIIWLKQPKLSHNLSKALNENRCTIINYKLSPYEMLLQKKELSQIITNERYSTKNLPLVKFDNLRNEVFELISDTTKSDGVQWHKLKELNRILKGFRLGELTVLTGSTGSGKTTFLSQYSLDLAEQGVNTLWGSFEIQNHRLSKIMMTQYAGFNLSKNLTEFDSIAQRYSKLPIYFMSFHGQEKSDVVLKTMANAVIRHDIKHIIIDNLQFMMGTTEEKKFFDKYST
jgi:twinkle protein